MPKKKVLIVFVLGLVLGFFIPRPSNTLDIAPSLDSESKIKLNQLRGKFQKISEEDISEYIRLKEMKAKYEKADEILGKILNVFLLDLGLKISASQLEELKAGAQSIADQTLPPKMEQGKVAGGEPSKPSSQVSDIKGTVDNRNSETNEQTSKPASMTLLSNPIAAWSSAKPLTQAAFNTIDGQFSGNIYFLDSKRTPLDLEMEVSNASYENGQIIGEFLLKTTDPSNSKYRDTTRIRANSKISNFRLASDGSILVEAMGGDGIFQLNYIPQSNSFQGNLYEKQGLDKFTHTGRIILNRH